MFYWIYDFPPWVVGCGFCVLSVGLSWLMILAARHGALAWIHHGESTNEMIGVAVNSLSAFFGLLLGLLSVAAYQNYSNVSDLVDREASSVAALYRDFSGYPMPTRDALQKKLRDYVDFTVDEGWRQQQRGVIPSGGTRIITELTKEVVQFEPSKKSEEIIHAEAFRQLNHLIETRRARLANVKTGLPAVLWWVVGFGAIAQIILIGLLKMELRLHMLVSALLAGFMGALIFIVAELDNPFRGQVSVSPDAIEIVRDSLMTPRDDERAGAP